jgi:COP9 signalosome complex subunit 7
MEQTKALNALEPFIALSKSASSSRAAADLVTRATSAPNTFIFTELLATPSIQALAESEEFSPYLELLQIFSYGTYQTYKDTANLPPLTDPQATKLRQLSLMTLASDRSNLTYDALLTALDLSSARQLEDLVISAVYAGLIYATLDPARQCVIVSGVAPLRDLSPGAIPGFIASLNNWSERCDSTLLDLQAQINKIREAAAERTKEQRTTEDKMNALLQSESRDAGKKESSNSPRDILLRRAYQKRAMGEAGSCAPNDEVMDLDEQQGAEDASKRANKRKM